MWTRTLRSALSLTAAAAVAMAALGCGDPRSTSSSAPVAGEACAGCHALPPAKDAHQVHVAFLARGDAQADPTGACVQCHEAVLRASQPDHILRADGTPVTTPAEVRFDGAGVIAGRTEEGATRSGAPAYDKAARTCSNVYCHGSGLQGATAGIVAQPAWDAPPGGIGCGKCHGIPPADHDQKITLSDCATCHGDAIDASGKPSPLKHVDGNVDFAQGVTTSCAACHGARIAGVLPGDPRSAPPTDAEGRSASDPAATSIGAHQNHVVAGTLGVAVACDECHVVPTALLATGHFDNQVKVTFGTIARSGAVAPSYDPTTQTCSNVYCHGGFPHSKASTPPAAPTWRAGAAAVACGTCHDLPPPAPAHPDPATFGVSSGCNGPSNNPALACHPSAYTPTSVDPKLHIDGRICPPFCTPATP